MTTKNNFTLFIKEHPASIGGFSSKRIKKIIQKYPNNFVLLDPQINTYDIIKKVNLILTINSKTGAEALSLYKKVISLGDSFYMHSSEVIYCEHFEELDERFCVLYLKLSGIFKLIFFPLSETILLSFNFCNNS